PTNHRRDPCPPHRAGSPTGPSRARSAGRSWAAPSGRREATAQPPPASAPPPLNGCAASWHERRYGGTPPQTSATEGIVDAEEVPPSFEAVTNVEPAERGGFGVQPDAATP